MSRSVSLSGAATSIIFVATKHVFCRDKSMLVETKNVATKMILVAAPASDSLRVLLCLNNRAIVVVANRVSCCS